MVKKKNNKLGLIYLFLSIFFILISTTTYLINLNPKISLDLLLVNCNLMAFSWFYIIPIKFFSFFFGGIKSKTIGMVITSIVGVILYTGFFYFYHKLILKIKKEGVIKILYFVPFVIILLFWSLFSTILC